jgi:hypothetical protein
VGSFVLGIMYVVAVRFAVLCDMGVLKAAGEAWRVFRARFKDHALMWLINWGLNMAAGLVVAIPIVLLALAVGIPAIVAGTASNWTAVVGLIAVFFVMLVVVSLFYTAVWGTFTSSLWTVFFRRVIGWEVAEPQTVLTAAYVGSPVADNSLPDA